MGNPSDRTNAPSVDNRKPTDNRAAHPAIAAVIVAAGKGTRFGGEIPKQFRNLAGRPILARTVTAFQEAQVVDAIVVVVDPECRQLASMALDGLDTARCPISIVDGAADRQGSVLAGLEALAAFGSVPGTVLIHDGVRPFVRRETMEAVVRSAWTKGFSGAIAALPLTDTVKVASSDGVIKRTLDRSGMYRAQTPQAFRFSEILGAHRLARGHQLTDDAAVAEAAGLRVTVVRDFPDNIKITSPEDMSLANVFFRQSNMLQGKTETLNEIDGRNTPRFGQGFDVHRLCPGNGVTLCGLWIPGPWALAGHSDADVALHTVTDAVYGALADGDIGHHFPPSDEQWKGADSSIFLRAALDRSRQRGFRLTQIDLTIICEFPKIGPHRDALRKSLCDIAGMPLEAVSVKATTTERLGFTGRGEGIAAMALVVLTPASRHDDAGSSDRPGNC